QEAVNDVVRRQVEAGIDVPDDGEMGKSGWITYLYERVSRLEARPVTLAGASMLPPSREPQAIPGAYAVLDSADVSAARGSTAAPAGSRVEERPEKNQAMSWVCTGPRRYDGTALARDIENSKAPLEGQDVADAFLPVVAPASAYWLTNEYYDSEEEFVF